MGASNAATAARRAPAVKPHVIIHRDTFEHLATVKAIRRQHAADLLMITGHGEVKPLDALAAGVTAICGPAVTADILTLAVTCAAGGHMWIEDTSVTQTRERIATGPQQSPVDNFTNQERAVYHMLGEGLTNQQIATRMSLAHHTVKNYISRIMKDLDMNTRTQIALHVHGVRT